MLVPAGMACDAPPWPAAGGGEEAAAEARAEGAGGWTRSTMGEGAGASSAWAGRQPPAPWAGSAAVPLLTASGSTVSRSRSEPSRSSASVTRRLVIR